MFKDQTIGIWGFGIVGKATLNFLRKQFPTTKISIYDKQKLSPIDQKIIYDNGAQFFAPEDLELFLHQADSIIPSPGIDLRNYQIYTNKFFCELDLFCSFWKKPIIAITGTIGKTTITYLISQILKNNGMRIATGGNIGTALLDLIIEQDNVDMAVLELSSFQLEYAQKINPAISIITNIYPNHLDRHTAEEYLTAKFNIMGTSPETIIIIPSSIYHNVQRLLAGRTVILHSEKRLSSQELSKLSTQNIIYYHDQKSIYKQQGSAITTLLPEVPAISYPMNWAIITAICEILKQPVRYDSLELPDHRLEHIATINNCFFFDDSKSTILEATYAAVNKLNEYNIILLLGGTSKGVDRLQKLSCLSARVAQIVCFGAEAAQLTSAAHNAQIKATSCKTLEEACLIAYTCAQHYAKPAVVLSPGGASFDLFTDYKARGTRFKQIVQELASAPARDVKS